MEKGIEKDIEKEVVLEAVKFIRCLMANILKSKEKMAAIAEATIEVVEDVCRNAAPRA